MALAGDPLGSLPKFGSAFTYFREFPPKIRKRLISVIPFFSGVDENDSNGTGRDACIGIRHLADANTVRTLMSTFIEVFLFAKISIDRCNSSFLFFPATLSTSFTRDITHSLLSQSEH